MNETPGIISSESFDDGSGIELPLLPVFPSIELASWQAAESLL